MSLVDILFRVDSICLKYEKYDIEKQRSGSLDDAFGRLYASFESQIDATVRKAEIAATETNRAKVVAMNAEIRRTKARLLEEIPKLQKLAQKKVKGATREEIETRTDLVFLLPERIKAIPEGGTSNAPGKQTGGWGNSAPHKNIKFDSDGHFDDEFFQQSEESSQFREDYELRKMKQDEGLDVISDGLDTLKNLAQDMNEELDRQVPLVDEIDTKVDKANTNLRNTNVKLKQTVIKMRSSQNFCIDIILLCILLGIAAYLYNILN